MFDAIYGLSIQSLAVVTAIFFVGFYWIGCVLLRPILRMFVKSTGGENDIVGSVLSAFGVFYGLLLSLIAVAAYQNLSEVESIVAAEASNLFSLYRDAAEFPEPQREKLQSLLRDYCRDSIDREWPV